MSKVQNDQADLLKSIIGEEIIIDLGVKKGQTQLEDYQDPLESDLFPQTAPDEPKVTDACISDVTTEVPPVDVLEEIKVAGPAEDPKQHAQVHGLREKLGNLIHFPKQARAVSSPDQDSDLINQDQNSDRQTGQLQDGNASARVSIAQVTVLSLTAVVIAAAAYSARIQIREFAGEVASGWSEPTKSAPSEMPVTKTPTPGEVAKSPLGEGNGEAATPTSVNVVQGAYVPVEPPKLESPKPIPAPGSAMPMPIDRPLPKPTPPGAAAAATPLANVSAGVAQTKPTQPAGGQQTPAEGQAVKHGPVVLDDTSKAVVAPKQDAPIKTVQQATPVNAQGPVKVVAQPLKDANAGDTAPKAAAAVKATGITVVDVPKDGKSVMVTNPVNRLPMKLVVGERLPNGKVIQSINATNGSISTTDGVTYTMD